MIEFDKNAGFLWAIILLGVLVPAVMALYASLRMTAQKERLVRLKSPEADLRPELTRLARQRRIQIALFGIFVMLVLIVRFGRAFAG